MKYMMSCRQPLVQLAKADEIKVDYKDRERIYDMIDTITSEDSKIDAPLYIYIPKNQLVDWDELERFSKTYKITIGVEDAFMIPEVKDKGYRVFWSYPATTFYEVNGLVALGVHEILLDAPLYFNLPKVAKLCEGMVEIRLVANKCFNNYMPRENGICGTYIRPEDVEFYEQYVSHLEFDTDTLTKELRLIDIYKKGVWPGNLNLLLTNLKVNVDNRGFNEEGFAARRSECGQRCQETGTCHFCPTLFNFINTIDKNKDYLTETYGLNIEN